MYIVLIISHKKLVTRKIGSIVCVDSLKKNCFLCLLWWILEKVITSLISLLTIRAKEQFNKDDLIQKSKKREKNISSTKINHYISSTIRPHTYRCIISQWTFELFKNSLIYCFYIHFQMLAVVFLISTPLFPKTILKRGLASLIIILTLLLARYIIIQSLID